MITSAETSTEDRGGLAEPLAPSPIHLGVRLAVAITLFAAAALCYQFEEGAFGNPGFGAPIESILNFGIVVDLLAAAVALLIMAPFALSGQTRSAVDTKLGSLAWSGAVVMGVALFAFAFSVPEWIEIFTGVRSRFDGLVGPLVLAGVPWSAGLVLSTVALRRPHRASRWVAGVALGVGLLLAASAVGAAALYGAGITD